MCALKISFLILLFACTHVLAQRVPEVRFEGKTCQDVFTKQGSNRRPMFWSKIFPAKNKAAKTQEAHLLEIWEELLKRRFSTLKQLEDSKKYQEFFVSLKSFLVHESIAYVERRVEIEGIPVQLLQISPDSKSSQLLNKISGRLSERDGTLLVFNPAYTIVAYNEEASFLIEEKILNLGLRDVLDHKELSGTLLHELNHFAGQENIRKVRGSLMETNVSDGAGEGDVESYYGGFNLSETRSHLIDASYAFAKAKRAYGQNYKNHSNELFAQLDQQPMSQVSIHRNVMFFKRLQRVLSMLLPLKISQVHFRKPEGFVKALLSIRLAGGANLQLDKFVVVQLGRYQLSLPLTEQDIALAYRFNSLAAQNDEAGIELLARELTARTLQRIERLSEFSASAMVLSQKTAEAMTNKDISEFETNLRLLSKVLLELRQSDGTEKRMAP